MSYYQGNLFLLSCPALTHVKTIPSGRSQNICSISNHPTKNEAIFADLGGHWGLVEKLETAEGSDATKEALASADLEDMEALFNDDEDDENSFSVSKVAAQTGYVKDDEGNLTFGGAGEPERPTSGLSGASETTDRASEMRLAVQPRLRAQAAFQPGASPEGLSNRFLVYNSVGIVKKHESEAESSIDVEFHDVAVHHALHLPNTENISMAALSRRVLALAGAGGEEGGRLIVNYFSSGDVNKEWRVEMGEEEITGVAAGDDWVAVTTSLHHLRLFSAGGIQREVTMIPGGLVTLAGCGDRLVVVWQGGDMQLCYSLYQVKMTGLAPLTLCPLPLPVTPGSELYWAGFSDTLTPCTTDTEGWTRALDTETWLWHPVLNSRDHTRGRSDFHYIVTVSHLDGMVRAVLCRGSKYPPTVPRPLLISLPLEAPLLSLTTERGELERTSLNLSLQAKSLSSCPEELRSEESEETLEKLRQQEVETLMKLFALACKSDHESRAVEVARLLPSAETVQLAIQYSVKARRLGLAEKLGKLAMELQEREEEEDNVKTPGDPIDTEDPESQDMFESQENPILKATRDRGQKPTQRLNIMSPDRERARNPFAKRLAGTGGAGSPSQSGIVFDSLEESQSGISPGVKEKTGFGQRKIVLVKKDKSSSTTSKQSLITKEKENRNSNGVGGGSLLKGFQLYFAENKDKFDSEADALIQWKGLEKEVKETYKVARVAGSAGEAGKRKRGGSEDTEGEDKKVKLSSGTGAAKQKLAGFAFSSK